MSETDYKSPWHLIEDEWEKLTASEKAFCLTYKRLLLKGLKINPALILEMNEIHERYHDFHLGCIPLEISAQASKLSEGA